MEAPSLNRSARTRHLDTALAAAIERRDLPCIVAMAADRQGLIYAGAFGEKTVGAGEPVALDTTFRLHSMTKAVTATAAMQLVERGRLTLDEPLAPLLPDLGGKMVLEGIGRDGKPILRPARTPITLRMLLTHTAGFSYDIWNADTLAHQKATGFPGPFTGQRQALNQPLAFEPGTRWHYSIGIDWVGLAVEAASGLDLETYFQRHIFAPLGMGDTTFVQTGAQKARRVTMHRRRADGGVEPYVLDRPETSEFFGGGGGLFGTVPDFLRFTSALLADGGDLVSRETWALMGRDHIGPLRVEPMVSVMPHLSADCAFWPGMAKGWGLSFLINSDATPEGRGPGSLAWAGLSNLYFWIDPARDVTGVFASQMLPFFDARALSAFQIFEKGIYNLSTS